MRGGYRRADLRQQIDDLVVAALGHDGNAAVRADEQGVDVREKRRGGGVLYEERGHWRHRP